MSVWYPPVYEGIAFNCLYCHVYANQSWQDMPTGGRSSFKIGNEHLRVSHCSHCRVPTIWLGEKIIYPTTGDFPSANNDLPDEVKKIYAEARTIAQQSPRAACALLRLAFELLLHHLGERKGSISERIGNLVQKKGLDSQIEQALEIVRVTGNEAVHPGQIVFDDTNDIKPLFDLIN